MRVRLRDQARADLMEHNQHQRELGGAARASKMPARMKASVLALKDNPDIAPPYQLAPGVRRQVVASGAFLVFYRVNVNMVVLHIRRPERLPATAQELENLPGINKDTD